MEKWGYDSVLVVSSKYEPVQNDCNALTNNTNPTIIWGVQYFWILFFSFRRERSGGWRGCNSRLSGFP